MYNQNGQLIKVNQTLDPFNNQAHLNLEGLASGIYFCRIQAGNSVGQKKVVLVKSY